MKGIFNDTEVVKDFTPVTTDVIRNNFVFLFGDLVFYIFFCILSFFVTIKIIRKETAPYLKVHALGSHRSVSLNSND